MKGISPLLASVLLIAVTVAIATLVMGWMSTTMRSTQTSVTNKTIQATECSTAGISIDDVYVANATYGGFNVTAIVRNSGQTDSLQLVSAVVFLNNGSSFPNLTVMSQDFDKGQLERVKFGIVNNTLSNSVFNSQGNFSKVIVTTNCGGISDTFSGTPKIATA
ncbi:MAG: archaellin/type IV pilin N-terminal domain-containing protein [Candidatus Aenigmatarchaeota archaeon]